MIIQFISLPLVGNMLEWLHWAMRDQSTQACKTGLLQVGIFRGTGFWVLDTSSSEDRIMGTQPYLNVHSSPHPTLPQCYSSGITSVYKAWSAISVYVWQDCLFLALARDYHNLIVRLLPLWESCEIVSIVMEGIQSFHSSVAIWPSTRW